MKIINAHVHMIDLENAFKPYTLADFEAEGNFFSGGNIDDTLSLMGSAKLIKQMDEAGIEQSVLFACDAPILYASNEYVAGLCEAYPKRLVGFSSVNPKRANAVTLIDSAVKRMGLMGIYFHPPLQDFFPNDKAIFPIYELLSALKIPAVFHVGSTPFGSIVRLDQANPLLLDEVANNFPRLKILLTSLGTLWNNEAFMVVEKHRNVYINTSSCAYELKGLLTNDNIIRVGVNKFIFGTAYPAPFGAKAHRMKEFVEAINSLPLPAEIKERIFFKNFQEFIEVEHKKKIQMEKLNVRQGMALSEDTKKMMMSDVMKKAIAKIPQEGASKAAELVARSFYKEMHKYGFSKEQVISVASEIISCLNKSLSGYVEKKDKKQC